MKTQTSCQTGVTALIAVMISPMPALTKSRQLFVLNTSTAIFRPVKFCWGQLLIAVLNKSKPRYFRCDQ